MDTRQAKPRSEGYININRRLNIWYAVILLIIIVVITRLFYLQIVRHDYYQKAANADQLRQYSIAAERGIIKAHQGSSIVPVVLNEKLYTLYADPSLVKDSQRDAKKLAALTKAKPGEYFRLMNTKNSRYVVLGKRLNTHQHDAILKLKLSGIGLQAIDYRTYPQGSLASQLLGFVNSDGKGTYGLEQALNNELSGTPGMLKAVTDANGVPLAASSDNLLINPKQGQDVVLTIDLAMQQELENYLKIGVKRAVARSASALIMDPNSGAVLAMANLPTYDPSQYYKVTDTSLFTNAAVAQPLEVGSTMKVLTAASALDQGVITPDSSYDDPGHWRLDGQTIKNVEEDGGPGRRNIAQVLNLSMNTGATWMLMQMGGGKVNLAAREHWHDYLVGHYQFSKLSGIEQGYEASGYVPDPKKGYALDLTYANTTFGQAMTATPLQMAAALSSMINGGKYYKPHLVDQTVSNNQQHINKPQVVNNNVVSPKVSKQMQSLMEYVVKGHLAQGFTYLKFPSNYIVGGKTGTAQIADPNGGYYTDRYNGTYIGFVGGDKPQYVIAVRVSEPHIGGYAGSTAAQPIFADLAHMLINNFNVIPKKGS